MNGIEQSVKIVNRALPEIKMEIYRRRRQVPIDLSNCLEELRDAAFITQMAQPPNRQHWSRDRSRTNSRSSNVRFGNEQITDNSSHTQVQQQSTAQPARQPPRSNSPGRQYSTGCFNCGVDGHMARECPKTRNSIQSQPTASASVQKPDPEARTKPKADWKSTEKIDYGAARAADTVVSETENLRDFVVSNDTTSQ